MKVSEVEQRLRQRQAVVAVVGLGYAGLPMAVEIASAGFHVIGYDVDASKVEQVNAGRSPVSNVSHAEVETLREGGQLTASVDPLVLEEADLAIICVPTPLRPDGSPDMRFVVAAGQAIADHLHPGMIVVLQSTCAPTTTSRLLLPELESRSGLRDGQDFFLIFAPERIDPGNTRFTVSNTPKLVGGTTTEATRLACIFYEAFIDTVIPVGSPEIAEMAKLVENTFRFINISFINEIALLCDRMGVNVWEVIEAAKSKPFAFMPHYPSPGVGGHCIPVVPLYLEAAARDLGVATQLISAADSVNQQMPAMIVDKLESALRDHGRPLLGATILAIGVTYKPDVADIRESAALRVMEQAGTRGARVIYHDPLIPSIALNGEDVQSVTLTPGCIASVDAVLLLTPHTTVDYDAVVAHAALVVDTHPALHPRTASNVVNVWVPSTASSAILPVG